MKKRYLVLMLSMAFFFALIAGAAAPMHAAYWMLLPNTPIREAASYSAAQSDYVLRQNEPVEPIGEPVLDEEGNFWQKIQYNKDKVGYVPSDVIYMTSQSITENVRIVKINPEKMGQTVPLYKIIGEEEALRLGDGENVVLLETVADYGEYSCVEYEGNIYFVQTKYITDTLTYNQKVAIIIAAVVVGVITCFFTFIVIHRKKS